MPHCSYCLQNCANDEVGAWEAPHEPELPSWILLKNVIRIIWKCIPQQPLSGSESRGWSYVEHCQPLLKCLLPCQLWIIKWLKTLLYYGAVCSIMLKMSDGTFWRPDYLRIPFSAHQHWLSTVRHGRLLRVPVCLYKQTTPPPPPKSLQTHWYQVHTGPQ